MRQAIGRYVARRYGLQDVVSHDPETSVTVVSHEDVHRIATVMDLTPELLAQLQSWKRLAAKNYRVWHDCMWYADMLYDNRQPAFITKYQASNQHSTWWWFETHGGHVGLVVQQRVATNGPGDRHKYIYVSMEPSVGPDVVTPRRGIFPLDLRLPTETDAPLPPMPGNPTANAGGLYTINVGDSLVLNGSGSTDPSGPSGFPLTYAWDLNSDTTTIESTAVSPTFTWTQLIGYGITGPGTYTIWLKVSNGLTDGIDCTSLTVI